MRDREPLLADDVDAAPGHTRSPADIGDVTGSERVIPPMIPHPGLRVEVLRALFPDDGGTRLGPYTVLGQLGAGAMGVVVAAHDERGHKVAIKILREEKVEPRTLERFAREGEVLRELAHPNIVQVLASEELDGRRCLVMEYVAGGSLRRRLERGPLPARECVKLALELADALTRVHHLGVVHRDLKPDNVLLAEDGTPRLTDFGVASLAEKTGLTAEGAVIGTLAYLSPEACGGQPLDARSDIWSFGVMLHEMLTGRCPFTGDTPLSVIAAITSQPAPRLERRDVPAALQELLDAMLAKERDARISSMRKIGFELELILRKLDDGEVAKRSAPLSSPARGGDAQASRRRGGVVAATVEGDAPGASGAGATREASSDRQMELIVLGKVRRHWIEGVLERSLDEHLRLALPARRSDDDVELPWGAPASAAARELAVDVNDDAKLLALFEEVDRALLIVGQPGSGKTTTVLRLTRALLDRAERDRTKPLPVVLNLGAWSERRESLETWIVNEMIAKYQVPRRLSQRWLLDNRLVMILDELDSAQTREPRGCVASINEFRTAHGLLGIVVCGRVDDYRGGDARLRLGGAVELLPPDDAVLERLLASGDERLAGFGAALRDNPKLRELARSPLMIQLIREVHSARDGESSDAGEQADELSGEALREQLFERFLERALRRRLPAPADRDALREWLMRLAAVMSRHGQRVFLIEQIQPSWLPGRRWRGLYLLIMRLLAACVGAWVMALTVRLTIALSGHPSASALSERGARWLGVPGFAGELLVMLLVMIVAIGALVLVELPGYLGRGRAARATGTIDLRGALTRACVWFPLFTGVYLIADDWPVALHMAFLSVAAMSTLFIQRTPPSFDAEIEPVEALGWSWRQAVRGAGVGVLFALPGVLRTLSQPLSMTLYMFWGIPAFFFMVAGLLHRRLEAGSRPNLGIRLSLRNAALAGVLIGGTEGLSHLAWWGPRPALLVGAITLPLAAIIFGLHAACKHATVRVLMAASGQLPLRLRERLELAVGCGVLRRVGGGFLFSHPLLQQHLAERGERTLPGPRR